MRIFAKHNLEFSKITDQIYLGTNMCCVHHFSKLKSLGVSADVDLEEEKSERPQDLEAYLWLPVKDHTAPTQTQLKIGAGTINEMVKAGKKVYVHCKNGHGRAPTMIAAYFILTGKTPTEAVELVKSRRPEIHLEDSQFKALEKFWENLKGVKN